MMYCLDKRKKTNRIANNEYRKEAEFQSLFFIFAFMESESKTILLSTAYFPPISWIKKALNADKVLIEAYETYPKQTYRNRCRIMTANGMLPLSIPVTKANGRNTRTKDIEIFYDEPWQRLHWRSIDAAYSNSPFYLYYKDELEKFFSVKSRFLLDHNLEIMLSVFRVLEKKIDISLTTEYIHQPEGLTDLRNTFTPKKEVKKSHFIPYHQVFEERYGFMADLSIIDLLFNEGPAAQSALNKE